MSSPSRSPSHRRRSHSAASPIPRRQPDDVKWRISAKRSRPSSIRSPSYKDIAHDQPAEKWDVDLWRRGKRARRDSNTEGSSNEAFGTPSDPIFPVEPTTTFTFPSSSVVRLPSTSAAFQFCSQRDVPQKKPRKPLSGRSRFSREASPREADRITSDEARRMRADALGELHRSVVESGEGLVSKMRDWESTRSRAARPAADGHQPKRSWRRLAPYYGTPQRVAPVAEQSEEDEDDIFIVGEASSFPGGRSPGHKKRALSLGTMDVDLPEMEVHSYDGDRSSSPFARSSGRSAYSSDDDGHADMDVELASSASGPYSTPALSHTYSTSNNSSVVSLPLPAQAGEGVSGMLTATPSSATIAPGLRSSSSPGVPPAASRSEKAIAALALAMANGAVGISDYEALRAAEGLTTLEESHAGELWS
ncbi:hypothetical protein C8Q78DRAFT_992421 [Trametes maxima]|nr:hypothetical protein C8Q78DRAFT_992421 [Trametes maxima]